jgi:hypothetical protein
MRVCCADHARRALRQRKRRPRRPLEVPLQSRLRPRHTLVIVVAGAAITGVLAGLARLGIHAGWGGSHALAHGPLFVLGVFGTVVSLERAQALGARWALATPAAFAASAVAMLFALPLAPWLAAASGFGMVTINVVAVGRRPSQVPWLLLAGSALLLLGNIQWARGAPVFLLAPAWMGFFVLTIAAERQRHSRNVSPPRWASHMFVAIVTGFVLAVGLSTVGVSAGIRLLGAAMVSLALWQLRFDIARETIRQAGYARFMGIGARAGMGWLLIGGGVLLLRELPPAGPVYDAALHAVFVGYVLSTAFAHSLDVLPTVAGVRVPFTPFLYGPLILLHVSLAVRVFGDLAGSLPLRQLGAIGNALAIALFGATVVTVATVSRRKILSRPPSGGGSSG